MSFVEPIKGRAETALEFLAMARQADPDPAIAATYLTALREVDEVWLEMACHELAKEPKAPYESAMPSVGTIYERALQCERRSAAALSQARALPPVTGERLYRCHRCKDEPNGWISLRCPDPRCERQKEHGPHYFVVRCPHWLQEFEPLIRQRGQDAIQKNRPLTQEFRALQDLADGRYRYANAVTL